MDNLSAIVLSAVTAGVVSFIMNKHFRSEDDKKNKAVLASGIIAELELSNMSVKSGEILLDDIISCLGEKADKQNQKGRITHVSVNFPSPDGLVFLTANLPNLGIFGKDVAKGLITYFHNIATIHKVLGSLYDDKGRINLSIEQKKDEVTQFQTAISVYEFSKETRQKAEGLIKELNKLTN